MRHRIFMCTIAATAVTLNLGRVRASLRGRRDRPGTTHGILTGPGPRPVQCPVSGGGVVTAVNPANGSLTINHEEIAGLMPPMEMMFHVEPRTLRDGVKPGDKIEFRVEGKTYTIRDIKVIEHTK